MCCYSGVTIYFYKGCEFYSRNRKYRSNSPNRQNQTRTDQKFCNPPPNRHYCIPPPNTQKLAQQYNSNFSTRISKPNEKYIPEHFSLYFNRENHLRTHLYPSESLALVGFETGRTYAIIEEDIVVESEGNPAAGPKDWVGCGAYLSAAVRSGGPI